VFASLPHIGPIGRAWPSPHPPDQPAVESSGQLARYVAVRLTKDEEHRQWAGSGNENGHLPDSCSFNNGFAFCCTDTKLGGMDPVAGELACAAIPALGPPLDDEGDII